MARWTGRILSGLRMVFLPGTLGLLLCVLMLKYPLSTFRGALKDPATAVGAAGAFLLLCPVLLGVFLVLGLLLHMARPEDTGALEAERTELDFLRRYALWGIVALVIGRLVFGLTAGDAFEALPAPLDYRELFLGYLAYCIVAFPVLWLLTMIDGLSYRTEGKKLPAALFGSILLPLLRDLGYPGVQIARMVKGEKKLRYVPGLVFYLLFLLLAVIGLILAARIKGGA